MAGQVNNAAPRVVYELPTAAPGPAPEAAPAAPADAAPAPEADDPYAGRVHAFGHSAGISGLLSSAALLGSGGFGIGYLLRGSGSSWRNPLIGLAAGVGVGLVTELLTAHGPEVGTSHGVVRSSGRYGGSTSMRTSGVMWLEGEPSDTGSATLRDALRADGDEPAANVAFVRRAGHVEEHALEGGDGWKTFGGWRPTDRSIIAWTQPDGALWAGPGATAEDVATANAWADARRPKASPFRIDLGLPTVHSATT
jgi:hypothetical protein